jgi:hypothetical protein
MRLILIKSGNLALFLFFGFLSSCSDKDEIVIPSYVLSQEKMEKILVDFSLAESAAAININNVLPQHYDSAYAFDVLKENQVSKNDYDTSIYFYSRHPDLYKQLYEAVLERIAVLETKRIATDSIKSEIRK